MAPTKKSRAVPTPVDTEVVVLPVVPESVVVEDVVVPVVPIVEVLTSDAQFAFVLERITACMNDLKQLQSVVKILQKDHVKLQNKTQKKVNKKAANADVVREPSGFAKPAILSDALCQFLEVEVGSQMARTVVTKHINAYIKKNNLQDPADKRHILLDDNLSKIITITPTDKLTYFNLQSFIKHHFNSTK